VVPKKRGGEKRRGSRRLNVHLGYREKEGTLFPLLLESFQKECYDSGVLLGEGQKQREKDQGEMVQVERRKKMAERHNEEESRKKKR